MNDKSQILCRICRRPVELTLDIATDEDGQAVHEMCYVKRIVVSKDELELVINRQAWVLDNDAGSDASP